MCVKHVVHVWAASRSGGGGPHSLAFSCPSRGAATEFHRGEGRRGHGSSLGASHPVGGEGGRVIVPRWRSDFEQVWWRVVLHDAFVERADTEREEAKVYEEVYKTRKDEPRSRGSGDAAGSARPLSAWACASVSGGREGERSTETPLSTGRSSS